MCENCGVLQIDILSKLYIRFARMAHFRTGNKWVGFTLRKSGQIRCICQRDIAIDDYFLFVNLCLKKQE